MPFMLETWYLVAGTIHSRNYLHRASQELDTKCHGFYVWTIFLGYPTSLAGGGYNVTGDECGARPVKGGAPPEPLLSLGEMPNLLFRSSPPIPRNRISPIMSSAEVQERLKKLGLSARTGESSKLICHLGGKGTPRRKVKRAPARSGADDKKLQLALKKLNTQPIQAIEEVNMFKQDGNVIHFAAPKVHAAVPSNTFAIYGNGEDKELTELVPGILNQLGPDSLASLRKLAESYQNLQKEKGEDDDEIPDLVEGENFENEPKVE
ncbi:hypothetical protein FOBRF1_003922 [Fusarium oxysporum]